jgi:hypothetical protein
LYILCGYTENPVYGLIAASGIFQVVVAIFKVIKLVITF